VPAVWPRHLTALRWGLLEKALRAAAAAGLGAHARVPGPLVNQEPPLLDHQTVLRRARVAFAKRRSAKDGNPLDAWGRPEDDQAVLVVATWTYIGAGYETEGERWLALSAAARAREHRRIAREELTTTTGSAAAWTLRR